MTITNEYVRKWVEEIAQISRPDSIYWCDGSQEEYDHLAQIAEASGTGLRALNQFSWPGCYAYNTTADDSEPHTECMYVCTANREDGADTRLWMHPDEMMERLHKIMNNALNGKIMYVVPYVMGPIGSPFAKTAVEITDSIYVVMNMRILTRMGDRAWQEIGEGDQFTRGVHFALNREMENRYVAHFPEERKIFTLNTEYGGYAFHAKSSMGMVLGSAAAVREGWLAEHMMILAIENPEGEVRYIAGAFPSNCGKSNLAFLTPPDYAKGYKCYTVGDDIAWLRPGPDGRLWAINPEAGFFSVLPGINEHSNPHALEMTGQDAILTNVAVSSEGEPWWEGKNETPPDTLRNWQGIPWNPRSPYKAAHSNSRFTAKADRLSSISPHWEDPAGVPISAIIFGGKSSGTEPLVVESYNWEHGIFLGATLSAERENYLERNPMGILPYLGTNLGDYLRNWLKVGAGLTQPPSIFRVNWFRKGEDGKYLWPGYRENFRVLQWILGRTENNFPATQSAIGLIPQAGDLTLEGLNLTEADLMNDLLSVDKQAWQTECLDIEAYFRAFQNLPAEFWDQLELLRDNVL